MKSCGQYVGAKKAWVCLLLSTHHLMYSADADIPYQDLQSVAEWTPWPLLSYASEYADSKHPL
jgi:hypothetical protein